MRTRAFSLLHGFLGAPIFWDPIVERLRHSFPSANFQTPWLPGHAPSTGRAATHNIPPTFVPSTFNDAIKWYASQVRSIAPCWSIGYSMGARLALATALQHPKMFCGVILISVHPGIAEESARQQRMQWEAKLKSLLQYEMPNGVNTHTMPALVNYFETMPIFDTQQALPRSVLQKQRQIRLAHDPGHIALAIDALGLANTPNLTVQLQQTTLPIKIITGALDNKYSQIGEELAHTHDTISHSAISNVGHNTVLESLTETTGIIASFVMENEIR